jgi:peptide/nickel transport system substrate-binding protein
VLKEWRPGDRIIYEAFPDYYKGPAPIKNVILKTIPDQSTQVVALEKGEIDMLDTNPNADARKSFQENKRLAFYECTSNAFLYVAFNNARGIFANKKVREAVSYAINRQDIIAGAKNGVGEPVEVAMLAASPEYPQGFKANPYNLEKAKQLLAEAGYPNGFTVKMKTIDNPVYTKPTEVIQQQLGKIGIKIDIVVLERGKWMSDITNADFEITFWAVVARVIDADYCQYMLFHSANRNGGGNLINANVPELDKLLEQGRVTRDLNQRKEIYAKTTQIIKDESLIVPLFSTTRITVADKNIKGVTVNPMNINKYYDYSW